jgi:predicted DNA-binding protein
MAIERCMMLASETLAIRITPELKERLENMAKSSRRSKAWVVSRALQLYLEDLEDVEVADSRVMDTSDEALSVDEFRRRHGL